ncbi:hypothetical protein BT69DRAFT_940564, partial [Atractiella rhizophila]
QTLPTLPNPSHRLVLPTYLASPCHLFTPSETFQILRKCKLLSARWNQVLCILGSVAQAKILIRLFRSGQISKRELDWRLLQPCWFAGPASVREKGEGEVKLAMSFYVISTPGLPRPIPLLQDEESRGEIGWDDILSKGRFALRCRIAQSKLAAHLGHPLAAEIGKLWWDGRLGGTKAWMEECVSYCSVSLSERTEEEEEDVAQRWSGGKVPKDLRDLKSPSPFIFTSGGSSWGDITRMVPRSFPCQPLDQHVTAASQGEIITLDRSTVRSDLRLRHGEFYLGSHTLDGVLKIWVKFDANVWALEMVKEWLEEIVDAAKWYLELTDFCLPN